jgi:hypothetical protein
MAGVVQSPGEVLIALPGPRGFLGPEIGDLGAFFGGCSCTERKREEELREK